MSTESDPFDDSNLSNGEETVASEHAFKKIGKYPIIRSLGSGAMGQVWLARNQELDIPVAIKTLPSFLVMQEPGFAKRFVHEARTAARINHSNVVRVHDCGIDEGVNYIVMEYVDGGNVRELLEEADGPVSLEQSLDIGVAMAEALCEAAAYNIVHRDIKPENIMLDSRGTAKLADLGLAKQLDNEETGMTKTGAAIGSPRYIAPEQVQNAKGVDGRADIYSLGATLYHLITGSIPYSATSSFEMMLKHVEDEFPHPQEVNPDIPDDVCLVICKMMEKSPDDRYQTPQELLAALRSLRDRYAAEEPPELPMPKQSKHPVMLALCAVIIMGLLAFIVWSQVIQRKNPDVLAQNNSEKSASINQPQTSSKPAPTQTAPTPAETAKPTEPLVVLPVPGKPYTVPELDIKLVPIAAGEFKMGSDYGHDHEKPVHTVQISRDFWMGKYEVTTGQFAAFVKDSEYRTLAEKQGRTSAYRKMGHRYSWGQEDEINWKNVWGKQQSDKRPAVCISWVDALRYCQWLTRKAREAEHLPAGYEYRLPTEAEWEYACRAGTTSKYYWGDDPKLAEFYEWINPEGARVNVVGDHKPNPWGLHDMLGNALELCLDMAEYETRGRVIITDTYKDNAVDPLCLKGDQRIARGKPWLARASDVSCSGRGSTVYNFHSAAIGFRLVLAPIMTDKLPPQWQ